MHRLLMSPWLTRNTETSEKDYEYGDTKTEKQSPPKFHCLLVRDLRLKL
jgi:hypothetical protein